MESEAKATAGPHTEEDVKVDEGEPKEGSKVEENKDESTMNEATGTQSNDANKAKTEPLRFRVIDDPKTTWTAEEDLRLLDGILTCGLGNWPEIAEHINTGGVSGEGGGGVPWAIGEGTNGCGGGKTDKQCM